VVPALHDGSFGHTSRVFRRRQQPRPPVGPPASDFDPNKVDLVAQSPQGVVNLVIVQDQRWSGLESEWTSLNQKIHNYVAFVLDGQMAKQYPDVAGRGWRILIHNYFDDPPEEVPRRARQGRRRRQITRWRPDPREARTSLETRSAA
jgi:predicted oxidoreductase